MNYLESQGSSRTGGDTSVKICRTWERQNVEGSWSRKQTQCRQRLCGSSGCRDQEEKSTS